MESEVAEGIDSTELVAEELDAVQASRDNDQPIEQNYRLSTHTSKNGKRKIAHSKVIIE